MKLDIYIGKQLEVIIVPKIELTFLILD